MSANETKEIAAPKALVRGGGVPIQYPMLNDTNYGLWAVKMKIILRALGVWDAIEGKAVVEEDKDHGALAAISQAVPDEVMMVIAEKDSAKKAWEAIKEMSIGEERVKKAHALVLKRQFERIVMEDSENIVEFSRKLTSTVGEIRSLGVEMKESTVVEKLFNVVPDRFLPIIGTIEQWGDMSTMSVTEAIGRLRVFEESLKGRRQQQREEEEQVMLTRAQWEALSLKEKKGSSEGSSSGKKNGSGKKPYRKFDKSKIKCFNCSEYGHFASECSQPKKERAFVVEKEDDEPALLMLETCELMETKGDLVETVTLMEENIQQLHLRMNEKDNRNTWYLDTGASNHMTGCRNHFTELNTSIGGTVKFGDGSTVSIGGRGTVLIKGRTGEHKALTDVYYIPKLTSNIISLGQLEERGCKVTLEGGLLRVFDRRGQMLIQVERAKNRLYILNLDLTQPVCLMARLDTDAWRWHARYGHLNFLALRKLGQEDLVEGLPLVNHVDQLCEGCLVGK